MAKLTAVVKSPEEILGPGARDVFEFRVQGQTYVEEMRKLAGTRIALDTRTKSDYYGQGWVWLKEWLRDFEEEVDWSQVPVDTKIEVRSPIAGGWLRRHFAVYVYGKVYAWEDGRTSFSANNGHSPWPEARLYREDNQ